MTIFGYARASTEGPSLEHQVETLKAAACETMFRETIGGRRASRPQLTALLATIAKDDTLVVTRLDRLARSTRDLLNILATLAGRGADFRSLGEPWSDTTAPDGRLMMTVLGGLAAFERQLIRARTDDGRARAKARGQHMGRPPALSPDQRAEALRALADSTATQADLARRFHVSQSTISRLANGDEPIGVTSRLDAVTERTARAFMRRLAGVYPATDALVFGSRARGTHTPDSDADIVVVLEGRRGDRYKVSAGMARIAFDVMLETGVLVDPLPVWESEMKRPALFSNPALLAHVKRDGLRL